MSENGTAITDPDADSRDDAVLDDAYNMIVEMATAHFIRGIETLETDLADDVARRELSSQIMQAEMFVDVAVKSGNHDFLRAFKEAVRSSNLSEHIKDRLIISLAQQPRPIGNTHHLTRA